MDILQVIQLTLLALHLYGSTTLASPPDISRGRNLHTSDECDVRFDSGLRLSDTDLIGINQKLESVKCLKSLSLKNDSIQEFEEGIFSNLTGLEFLDLSDNKLSRDSLFSFGFLPSLKELILDGNQQNWNPFTLNKEVYLPELTYLGLRNMETTFFAINWSEYFPKLEVLLLSRNRLVSADDFFKTIPPTVKVLEMRGMKLNKLKTRSLKNVTTLVLSSNSFHSIKGSSCDEEGLCLENFDGLENLSLDSCRIELIDALAFEHMTKLVHLDIANNNIKRISSGTFGYSPLLSKLDISDNPLIDVSFITELKILEVLNMESMTDNRSIESLWSLSPLPVIQILILRHNEISFIPTRFLDNLQGLREIYLDDNHLSSLSPGSWQKNLTSIGLSSNNVSKIEDLHLSEATSLHYLSLYGNKLVSIDPEVRKTLPENLDLEL
ncbi:hypothetical protein QAD02_004393 [Eretmocerus hayati]|uniref:Uncharacterized protein n=1 Tax=Eretmocerus hayati TaxID=131215 RepID=A0ACC2NPQ9_9HYME|nr:hypothetical protein QAD02_004393 [Eretmocerus hayati]